MKVNRQGRIGKGVANLFSSLLRNARDGSTYFIDHRSKNGMRILRNASSTKGTSGGGGKARAVTFPYELFESSTLFILKHLPIDELRALLAALETADDKEDVRLRLRDALRKWLGCVYLLVVPRGRDRLCAVQLWFDDNSHFIYLIFYRHALAGPTVKHQPKPAQSAVTLLDSLMDCDCDFRKREDVDELERTLLALPLCLITQSLEDVENEFRRGSNEGWKVKDFLAWWESVKGVVGQRSLQPELTGVIGMAEKMRKNPKYIEFADVPVRALAIMPKTRQPPD